METIESRIIQIHVRLGQNAKERAELLRELAELRDRIEADSWQNVPAQAWAVPDDDWIGGDE